MTNELTVRKLTPNDINMIMQLAPIMKDSRLFGVATESQAAAICLKGYELGLGITASFEFIHVIDSKPTLSPRGALALILNSAELDSIDIKDEVDTKGVPSACTVLMKRKNGFSYTAHFTMDDAKRAGLIKPGSGWEKYPSSMLKWRCVGFAADVVFPDVIGGMKRSDELGAEIDMAGNVVDATWTPVNTMPAMPATAQPVKPVADGVTAWVSTEPAVARFEAGQPERVLTLQDLVGKFGPEAVMLANDGRIPASDEELATVAAKLGA